ncbi:BTAD domain-containing putative transcriptional regulator [Deinococcus navajonensis]|uniref:BTAD domain-containing putative transcriptional regulator n=1 Tax=Deinococcus navajonensis TaxID=309884 RepID=A0ABV8XK18_9DEIO
MLELSLLGTARVQRAGAPVTLPTRKALALVAYLTVEGPTPRGHLAGLLWDHADEPTARSHLRRELHRLRHSPLAPWLKATAGEVALLTAELRCDVHTFAAAQGPDEAALALWRGEFLEGFGLRDAEGFERWLADRRAALAAARQALIARCAAAREQGGDLRGALALRQSWLGHDELSEPGHREVMRLHARLGERAAALRQFGRLQRLLADELGLTPLAETLALAREIGQRGGTEVPTATEPPGPLTLAHPPLVGREREWAQLEAAWARGLPVYLWGEPGAGKSRLLRDFVATKGRALPNDGHPGDAHVPYASLTRGLRTLLDRQPGLTDELPAWALRELSRLLPELWPEPLVPGGPEDQRRLFEAGLALLALGSRGCVALTTDDLHLYDPQSFAFGAGFTAGPSLPPWPALRVLSTFNRPELPPGVWPAICTQVERGAAALIEVQPLPEEALRQLLDALALLDTSSALSRDLYRYTGGNPQFVLDTLQVLQARGIPGGPLPENLRPPERSLSTLQRRVGRLPPQALALAQLAAVAGGDVDLSLAGRVLGTDPLQLTPALQALENEALWRGDGLPSDLVRAAVLGTLPPACHRLLRARLEAAQAIG